MQSVSSRIWTHVAVSISFNNNHYTTGTAYKSNILTLELVYMEFFQCGWIWLEIVFTNILNLSAGAVKYVDCIFKWLVKICKTPPTQRVS